MDKVFSKEVMDIIAQSREIAMALGYGYISTLHLFLADCKLNHSGTIRKFVFETDEDFQTFYNNQRWGEATTATDSLPLTVEAEKTIRKAFKLWNNRYYPASETRPYHLFMAAALIPGTFFCSLFPQEFQLYEKLEQYYIAAGQIDKGKVDIPFGMRLERKIKRWVNKRKQ